MQVADAHIPGIADALLSPEAPLALRLSGQLLLGVCRLYARKVAYLHQASAHLWYCTLPQHCATCYGYSLR